jgi:hypothetical protein
MQRYPEMLFLQEYGARFLTDIGAVFRNIRKAIREINKIETENMANDPTEYVAGVDWGRSNDYTVVTILDARTGHLEDWDRFRKIPWHLQVERVAKLLREYKAKALTDSTGLGEPVFDMLYKEYNNISAFNITNRSKMEIIDNLAIMIENGAKYNQNQGRYAQPNVFFDDHDIPKITYPDIPQLIEELSMFGADITPSGRVKYNAPRGFNDDFVISLALAAWQLKRQSIELGFEFSTIF